MKPQAAFLRPINKRWGRSRLAARARRAYRRGVEHAARRMSCANTLATEPLIERLPAEGRSVHVNRSADLVRHSTPRARVTRCKGGILGSRWQNRYPFVHEHRARRFQAGYLGWRVGL